MLGDVDVDEVRITVPSVRRASRVGGVAAPSRYDGAAPSLYPYRTRGRLGLPRARGARGMDTDARGGSPMTEHTRSARGRHQDCGLCATQILPGERYRKWVWYGDSTGPSYINVHVECHDWASPQDWFGDADGWPEGAFFELDPGDLETAPEVVRRRCGLVA